jgi:GcrA cell cycle regulator
MLTTTTTAAPEPGPAPGPAKAPARSHSQSRSQSHSPWTPELVEQLKNGVSGGLTCSEIAAEIGVTRNAVIGKIHRLGLSPGRPAAPARSCPPRARQPRTSPPRQFLRLMFVQASGLVGEDAGPVAIESMKRCSLLELAPGKCRWPVGDPCAADFAYCGNEAIAGFSYCSGHARMAYRVPARRRA